MTGRQLGHYRIVAMLGAGGMGEVWREEWNREIHRALELDPLNDFNWSFYGWQLNYVGRYDEAIPIFKRLLPTGPNKSSPIEDPTASAKRWDPRRATS